MKKPVLIPRILMLCVVVLFVLFMSVHPFEKIFYIPGLTDKHVHGIVYAMLSFALIPVLKSYGVKGYLLGAIFLAFFFGFMMEVLQLFVPGRAFELGDLGANFIGACVGGSLGWLIIKIKGSN